MSVMANPSKSIAYSWEIVATSYILFKVSLDFISWLLSPEE